MTDSDNSGDFIVWRVHCCGVAGRLAACFSQVMAWHEAPQSGQYQCSASWGLCFYLGFLRGAHIACYPINLQFLQTKNQTSNQRHLSMAEQQTIGMSNLATITLQPINTYKKELITRRSKPAGGHHRAIKTYLSISFCSFSRASRLATRSWFIRYRESNSSSFSSLINFFFFERESISLSTPGILLCASYKTTAFLYTYAVKFNIFQVLLDVDWP